MWNFKPIALLFLIPILINASLRFQKLTFDPNDISPLEVDPDVAEICEQGQYYDVSLNHCFNCTTCSDFMYELETCSKEHNTVCGWCGNKVDFDEMSDSVLVSYQHKCLMSNLEFVDMRKLENQLDDSSSWIDSKEDSVEANEEEEQDVEQNPEFTEELERQIAKVFKNMKNRNMQLLGDQYDPVFPHETGFNSEILTKEEVFKTLKQESQIPNENFLESNEEEYDDSDEENSNERLIKWDKWVDDRVKPIIAQRIEIMKKLKNAETESAEEINFPEESLLFVEAEPVENFEDVEMVNKSSLTLLTLRITALIIGFVIIGYLFGLICRQKQRFRVVEIDPEEYKILQKCGQNAERAMKAEKHVHENPLCLP